MGRGKRSGQGLLGLARQGGPELPLSDGERSSHTPPPVSTKIVVVMRNGKVRTRLRVPLGADESDLVELAKAAVEERDGDALAPARAVFDQALQMVNFVEHEQTQ